MSQYHDARPTGLAKPKKKKPLPTVQVQPKPAPAAPVTPSMAPPKGPPSKLLQQGGFMGGLGDFAERAADAVAAHVQSYGVKPHPEIVKALAASDIPREHFGAMFQVPQNATAAKAQAAVRTTPSAPVTPNELIAGLKVAVKGDNFDEYIERYGENLKLLQKDDRYRGKVNAVFASRWDVNDPVAQGLGAAGTNSAVFKALKLAGLAGQQVAEGLIYSPAGAFLAGRAVVQDVDAAAGGDASFKRSRAMGEAMVKQVKEDVTNPGENPGYLLLDVFGALSLGAGGVARTANAARTGSARALVQKAPLKRKVISHGGYTEEALLSSNPLVAQFQSALLSKREKGAAKRLEAGGATRSILLPDAAQEWFERNFSFERKVGREASRRQTIEHTANLHLARELDHAAATANATSRVLGKVGRKRLTRGQQKAIWVLATDDPDPLAANVAFHERMIAEGKGDKKAHQRHLADLQLAAKELENPSPAFQKVVDMTRDVVTEMERLKVEELGLAPMTAEGRVAKLAQVLRGEEPVGGAKQTAGSFYLPTQPRGKRKRGPSEIRGFYGTSVGPFGIPIGRRPPELTHEFTGKAIQAGNIRIDSTALATEAYARTVRAASVKAQHEKLWDSASPVQRTDWDIPIRDTNEIPDRLREVVSKIDEGQFTKHDADLLPDDMAAIIRELYPEQKTLSAEEMEHVRWIDSRRVGELEGAPSRTAKSAAQAAQAVNAPVRFARLYLRPAYILNKLGNNAMLVLDQGFLKSGQNMARAMTADHRYGAVNANAIRAHVGQGKSKSFSTPESGRMTRAVAEWWSRWTDRDERVASWLYYADRKGYKTREQVDALLNDKTHRGDLVEVTRRANKALVEFDNLAPLEKNLLRHLIFVYPWVSRSGVWSMRTIMEHPAKVAVLANLGEHAMENDPLLDKAPEWYKRTGYVPVGWNGDGTPKVVNPASVNTFTTLGQFLSIGKGATMGDKYAALGDLAGPGVEFAVHAAYGSDEYGNQYPGSQWGSAAKDVLLGLPQLSRSQRREDKPLKEFDVTQRDSLEARYRSALKQTVFSPGWLDGYGSMLVGGFNPRGVNLGALEARYWKDATDAQKKQWQRKLLADALDMQGDLLGTRVPGAVAKAVRFQVALTDAKTAKSKELGRTLTDREEADLVLDRADIPEAERAGLAKTLDGLPGDQIGQFTSKVLTRYADGKALREWDADVRLVASFNREVMGKKVKALKAQGLAPSASLPSDETLRDYGRRYLAYTKELKKLAASDATPADIRAFVDDNDKPQDGMPSFAAMGWANLPPDSQEEALRDAAATSWSKLSSFDKKLLGVNVDAAVSRGWAEYEKATAAYRAQPGSPSLQAEQKQGLARQIDRVYPGFAKDWTFAQQPRAVQFEQTNVYETLPDRDLYDSALGGPAKQLAKVIRENGNRSYYLDHWRRYIAEQVRPWLEKHPDLKEELNAMGEDFMPGLVSQG